MEEVVVLEVHHIYVVVVVMRSRVLLLPLHHQVEVVGRVRQRGIRILIGHVVHQVIQHIVVVVFAFLGVVVEEVLLLQLLHLHQFQHLLRLLAEEALRHLHQEEDVVAQVKFIVVAHVGHRLVQEPCLVPQVGHLFVQCRHRFVGQVRLHVEGHVWE